MKDSAHGCEIRIQEELQRPQNMRPAGSGGRAMTSILENLSLGRRNSTRSLAGRRRCARLRRCRRCRRLLHLPLSHGAKKIGNHPLRRSFIVEGEMQNYLKDNWKKVSDSSHFLWRCKPNLQ